VEAKEPYCVNRSTQENYKSSSLPLIILGKVSSIIFLSSKPSSLTSDVTFSLQGSLYIPVCSSISSIEILSWYFIHNLRWRWININYTIVEGMCSVQWPWLHSCSRALYLEHCYTILRTLFFLCIILHSQMHTRFHFLSSVVRSDWKWNH
jgi:hypothetical protein